MATLYRSTRMRECLKRLSMSSGAGESARGVLERCGGEMEVALRSKRWMSKNVVALTFALPRSDDRLGLAAGRHVDVSVEGHSRPYTPVRPEAKLEEEEGCTTLVVKVYDDGQVSPRLGRLEEGNTISMEGPKGRIEYRGRGVFSRRLLKSEGGGEQEINASNIGLIAGGSGLTPMLQIARKALSDPKDKTSVSMIFANRSEADIFLKDQLDELARTFPGRFRVHYTIDQAFTQEWPHEVGLIDVDKCSRLLPSPGPDTVICCCGPPPMIKKACKPSLSQVGHDPSRVLCW